MAALAECGVENETKPKAGHGCAVGLFVSTSLDTWTADRPEVFARDVQVNDTGFRRLDPEYYSWLRSRMALAKQAAIAGHLPPAAFEGLRVRFNAIHEWAVEYLGESSLLDAIRNLDARNYGPPMAEPDAPRRALQTVESVPAEARALVDEIRDRALALGWTPESLDAQAGSHRAALGVDRSLVWYLKPGDQIGEVTTHSIEIILPSNVRQRFYNPNVDQPWIRRVP